MTEIAPAPLADTSDMVGLHRVFRDAFDRAESYIATADPADPERVEMVASYYDNVLRLVHAHHDGEDELLTPRLVQRCTPAEAAEVERVAAQHREVLGNLDRAEVALAGWRSAASAPTAAAATTALGVLGTSLRAHLDDEEQTVLPIAARYITAPEWGELPGHAMQNFTGDKLWLILGLVQEQMTPQQVETVEANMPPPVAAFWTGQGRPMFTDFVGRLRR